MKEEQTFTRAVALVYLEKFGNKKPTKKQLVLMEDVYSMFGYGKPYLGTNV